MADRQIENLRRQLEADPEDAQAQLDLAHARARLEGSSIFLEPLNDRLEWNKCSEPIQDLTINAVAERLKPDYEWLETQVYSCANSSHRIGSFTHLKSGLILNLLPGGSFVMGERGWFPQKTCKSSPFLLGRFPVRQSCWDKVGAFDERGFFGPDRPIEGVSWKDCQAWLDKAGGELIFPSEMAWEYACRAGADTGYFWGANEDNSYFWHSQNSEQKTHAVTKHETKWNSFGLRDMSGHVNEWCHDNWTVNYSSDGRFRRDSFGPRAIRDEDYKIIRGGSWVKPAIACRSGMIQRCLITGRSHVIGFRAARLVK